MNVISVHRFAMDTDAPASVCGIYAIRHLPTGKFYVGQVGGTNGRGFLKRCQEHVYNAVNSKCHHAYSKFGRAVRKYGLDQFEFMVLELIDKSNENAVFDAAELRWMTHFNSFIPSGYNAHAGPTPRGVKRSEETRKRMSEGRKKMLAENHELADALRNRLVARNASEATRLATALRNSTPESIAARTAGIRKHRSDPEKLRAMLLVADETRLKNGSNALMSRITKTRMQNPAVRNITAKAVICIDTGMEFPSVNEVARQYGVSKTAVRRWIDAGEGRAQGPKFKFLEKAP